MRKITFNKKELKKIRDKAIRARKNWVWGCPCCEYEVKDGFKKNNGHLYCKSCGKVLISDFEKIIYEDEKPIELPTTNLATTLIDNTPDEDIKKALKAEAMSMTTSSVMSTNDTINVNNDDKVIISEKENL
jgi:hypothetical protein